MPFEIAAPERQEPPLANLQSSSPVAPSSAYMWPSTGSSEQPNTTPLAVVTGPEVLPPWDGVTCHRISPVAASNPVHTPCSVVVPEGSVQSTALLLALAV